jgi:hypothetical protein
MVKVKIFTSGADNASYLEQDLNEFIEQNNVKVVDVKFNYMFYYDPKDEKFDGGSRSTIIRAEFKKMKEKVFPFSCNISLRNLLDI